MRFPSAGPAWAGSASARPARAAGRVDTYYTEGEGQAAPGISVAVPQKDLLDGREEVGRQDLPVPVGPGIVQGPQGPQASRRALEEATADRALGSWKPLRQNSSAMSWATCAASPASTRAMMEPPKPPPVILAP